jgi:hypothetical protein
MADPQLHGKALKRELVKYLREKDRAALKVLRARINAARVDRKHAIASVRAKCKETRAELRKRHQLEREALRRRHREEWEAFRTDCELRLAQAKVTGDSDEQARRRELKEAKALQAQMRRTAGERQRSERRSLSERQQESDDEVRANLTPDLVPIFDAMGATLKVRGRRTRTEAFLGWVHDHAEEAHKLQNDAAERKLAALIQAHERLATASSTPIRYAGTVEELSARLSDPLADFLGDSDPTGKTWTGYVEQMALVIGEALGREWSGKYWKKGNKERVYVKQNGKERGYLQFGPEQEIDTSHARFPSMLRARVPDLIDNILGKD